METRLYQTPDIDLQQIAQAVVLTYQAQGYAVQHAGAPEQVIIQLKKESALRVVTGFNKALTLTMQKVAAGTLVTVGAHDWVDQIAVGAVGLALHPLLVTAAVGAVSQHNVVHEILLFIDLQIHQQQPTATLVGPIGEVHSSPSGDQMNS